MTPASPLPESVETCSSNLKFGMFMPPLHPPRTSVTRDLAKDIEIVEWMDDIGFNECWFGEHHTSGYEIITSPDLMIMQAAERTKRIRLGTGVVSLAYHHPLVIANRMAQLDHQTGGRVMMGVGPGSLPSDAKMLGIPYTENRRRMEESMDAIMHLFTSEEPLTVDCGWFKLEEGLLNYAPFQKPHPPVYVASVASPNAPRIAGKWGLPLQPLAPRSEWRLTGPMHIAETREQAEKDVEFGLQDFLDYFFRVPVEFFKLKDEFGNEVKDASAVEIIRGTGFGVIGTPDDAIAHIERLQRETGGFGAFLLLAHSWANRATTLKSLELIAEYVIPHFQGSLKRRQGRWASMQASLEETFNEMRAGMDEAVERHNREYGGGAGQAEGRITV
jgi:limonene 1,2-monooxygenase